MPRKSSKITKRDLDTLRRRAELEVELDAATAAGDEQKAENLREALVKLPAKAAKVRSALKAARKAGDHFEVARLNKELESCLPDTLADAGQPGLYAQARRGRVRFLFRYRPPGGGGRRHMQIDWYGAVTIDQARQIAQNLRGQIAARVDPQAEREKEQRQAITVSEAVESYLRDLNHRAESGAMRGKRSGYASAKNRLERHVVPRLGSVRLRDVTSDQVRRMHKSMKSTPVEANRTLTALSAAFGYADKREIVPPGFNPARHVERYAETGRRRALTTEEMMALGDVLDEAEKTGTVPAMKDGKAVTKDGKPGRARISPVAVLAVRLLALTGFRRSEVLGQSMKNRRGPREGLRWGDVDIEAGLVHLRDTKTGRQTRVIGAAVVELLRGARPKFATDSDPVCPGTCAGEPFVGIDKARGHLWRAAGIEETAEGRADLHSLRHSFASIGAHAQGGRHVGFVSALLGHGYQAKAITERYISQDPELLRPAADAVAGEIARLLGLTEPGEVVAFVRKG